MDDDLSVYVLNLQTTSEKLKLLDHVIKWLYDFMEGSFSIYATNLAGLVAIGIVVAGLK